MDSENDKDFFTTIGSFQHMKYEELDDDVALNRIAKYHSCVDIGKARYAVFPVFFFDGFDFTDDPFPEEYKQSHFFSVGILKLNKIPALVNNCENSEEMLKLVWNKINEAVKKAYPQEAKENFIKIYPSLGAADFVAVVNGTDFGLHADIWTLLRKIPLEVSENETKYLFKSTSSFFAVHNSINLNAEHVKQVIIPNICINSSLKTLENSAAIRYFYEKYFETKNTYHTQGEYDLMMYKDECPLDKVLYLLGAGNENRPAGVDVDDIKSFNKLAESCIEACNVRFNYGNKPEGDKFSETGSNKDPRIDKLRLLYAEVEEQGLPVPAKRTLDFLVDKCISLLQIRYQHAASSRLYIIIKHVLNILKNRVRELSVKEVTQCLGNIAVMVDSLLMADNLRNDNFGANDIETIHAGTKIYYAYEHMMRKLICTINDDKKPDPLIFLTINPLEPLISIHHFKQKNNQNNIDLYNVNLPHIGHFDLKYSIPYLGHESGGHYFFSEQGLHVRRNRTLLHLVLKYTTVHVWERLPNVDLELTMPDFLAFLESLFESVGYLFDFEQPVAAFRISCMEFLHRAMDFVNDYKDEITDQLKNIEDYPDAWLNFCLYDSIANSFESLIKNEGPIIKLSEVIKESRADIVMVSISDYNFKQYLESQFRYMDDNNIKMDLEDAVYIMRLSAVLSVLTDGDIDKLKEHLYKGGLTQSEKALLSKVIYMCENNVHLIKPLVEYLSSLLENVNTKLAEDHKRKIDNTLKLFRYPMTEKCAKFAAEDKNNIPSTAELAALLYEEWYDALCFWVIKGEEDLKDG